MSVEKTITINVEARAAILEVQKLDKETKSTLNQLRGAIPINVDGKKATKELKGIGKGAKSVVKEIENIGKTEPEITKITKAAGGLGGALPKAQKGAEGTSKGFQAMGLAWKAMGIGAVISAVVMLADKFSANQRIMDAMNIVSHAMGEILVKLSNVFLDLGATVIKAFKNPLKLILDFNNLIKDKVNKTIGETIKGLGLMGKAIALVFKGEFKEAAEIAKEGAKTLFNANPIVQATNAAKDYAIAVFEVGKSIVETTKETAAHAVSMIALANEVKIGEAEQRKLQLTYQKDAELQRQLRDDITLTIAERIAANEELGRVLQEQFEKEEALVKMKIRLAQEELAINKDNVDLKIALINAESEMADLSERITGQESEQKVNLNALNQEQSDLLQSQIDKEKELYGGEARETMLAQFEEWNMDVSEIRADAAAKAGFWTNEQVKNSFDAELAQRQMSEATAKAKVDTTKGLIGAIGGLLEEGTAGAKAAAMAGILIDTAMGISAAIAGATAAAAGTGPAAILTQPLFMAQMIMSVLSGIAQAKATLGKVKGGGGGGGGSASVSVPSGGSSMGAMPSQLEVPNIESIQTSNQLGGETGIAPVQAYVVENDISNSQALQEELETQSTL